MARTAVITGAGSGIGFALSVALIAADPDMQIIAIGRSEKRLIALQAAHPGRVLAIAADVGSAAGRDHIASGLAHIQRVDYLVHCAATVQPIVAIENLQFDDWRRAMQANVEGPLFLTRLLLAKMQQRRVMFFTSDKNIQPVRGASSYCISKAAQQMVYQCLQEEIPAETAVFCMLSPGLVDTPMQKKIRQSNTDVLPAADALKTIYEQNGLLSAATVASFATWLLLRVDKNTLGYDIWDIYDASHQASWKAATPAH